MNTPRIFIALGLGVFFILSLYTLAVLPLGLDEAYYAYWAQHPALSYFDHPPLIAWLMALSTALIGNNESGVRIGGFLCLWLGFGAAFATARCLFPQAAKIFAWEYVFLLNLTLIFPGASIIQTPDTPLFACWMAALYFGAKVIVHPTKSAWYFLGLVFGLGLLAKYTMVLFAIGFLLFLLFTSEQRYWLLRREPWLAALLALIVFLPVIIWNAQHDWLSFRFQLNQGFEPDPAPLVTKALEYVLGQAIIVSPLLALGFIYYHWQGIAKSVCAGEVIYRYLAFLTWTPLLFFAGTTLKGAPSEANWPAPAYIAGLLFAWAIVRTHDSLRNHWFRGAFLLTLILNFMLRIHLAYPWLPISPAQDRLREFAHWPALGRQIQSIIDAQAPETHWFLIGDVGTRLAEALFYTHYRYLGIDLLRPERYLFLSDTKHSFQGKNALLLLRNGRSEAEVQTLFGHYFQHTSFVDRYTHHYRNTHISRYDLDLYLGENFLGH